MRSVLLNKPGIENLTVEAAERPVPKPDEVLVRMKAATLNYVDLALVEGRLGADLEFPFLPVADGAGIVEEVGTDVEAFHTGDLVATVYIPKWQGGHYTPDLTGLEIRPGMGVLPGQLTEYKTFKADEIIKVPEHLTAAEAATLPIAAVTAWNALKEGDIRAGKSVLIHGTGGVSIFALQFAKLSGAEVVITSASDDKLARACELGADHGINYVSSPDMVEEVVKATRGRGVDIVVETVGGKNVKRSLDALSTEGVISIVGFLDGKTANVPLIPFNLKRATLVGISVGSKQDFTEMLRTILLHDLHPVISETFALTEVQEAFRFLKSAKGFGKVVIDLS